MTIDVYDYFEKRPKFYKHIGNDFLLVEYKCPLNVEEFQLWTIKMEYLRITLNEPFQLLVKGIFPYLTLYESMSHIANRYHDDASQVSIVGWTIKFKNNLKNGKPIFIN